VTWLRSPTLVVALCVAGLIETWVAYGMDLARMALVVALVVPLLRRRSSPAPAMLVIAAAFLLQVPVDGLRLLERTFVCYLALIWGGYACARNAASLSTLAVAMAGPFAGGMTVGLVDRSVLSGVLGAGILAVAVWVGHAVRTRVTARRTLERQAQEIVAATASAASAHASQSRALVAAELQATLADRVQEMVGQAQRAASRLPRDVTTAAQILASVEEDGRVALHDMRLALRVLRGQDQLGEDPSCPSEQELRAAATIGLRRPWDLAIWLALAAMAVVVFNLAAGFTTVADYVFPLLLVALAGVGLLAMRRQTELLAAVRRQTVELQALREAVTKAAAIQERMRLARELHDVVAHHLMVMVVQAGAARRTLESGRPGSCESLTAIGRTGAEVIGELHSLLHLVDPGAQTGPAYGMGELELLVDRVRAGGLDVDLSIVGDRRSLPGGLDLVAHRIVQESLTNVIRHAGATRAHVLVDYGTDRLTIEVTDDGRGLTGEPATGLGLLGMRERAEMYGGYCQFRTLPAGGVRVLATLPLERRGVPG